MKKLILFTGVISLVTIGSFVVVQSLCKHVLPHGVSLNRSWYASLASNPEHKAMLSQKEKTFRTKADALCMKICDMRYELLKMLEQPEVQKAEIDRRIEEIGVMQTQLEKDIAAHILDIRNDLTPENRKEYIGKIHDQFKQSLKQSGYDEIMTQQAPHTR